MATIKGSTVFLYHGPGVYNESVTAGTGANDLCFASDSDGWGTPGILYTTANGLYRVTFDAGSHEYVSAPVSTHNLWKNAPLIRSTVPILGTPLTDALIGVKSDQQTVIRSIKQVGGFANPTVLFDMGYPVLDIVLLNWDSDIQTELAILYNDGVHHGVQVRELDGTLRMSRTTAAAGDAIAAVRAPSSTDSLALVTRLSGDSILFLFRLGFTPQGPTTINSQVFNSMTSGDLDGDNDDDLVLASESVSELTVLQNTQGTPWFPPASVGSVGMRLLSTSESEPSSGQVVCANLFNEWIGTDSSVPVPGFALVLPDRDGLRLKPGSASGLPWTPQIPAPGISDLGAHPTFESGTHYDGECMDPEPGGSQSRWTMTLGDGWGLNNANRVQMIVRKSNDNVPEDQAWDWGEFTVNGTSTSNPVQGTVIGFEGVDVDDEWSDTRYFVQVRPVKINLSTGAVQRAWRWSLSGISATCTGTEGLLTLPGAQNESDDFPIDFFTCAPANTNCNSGVAVVPSAVPLSQIPDGPGVMPGYPPPQ